MRGRIVFIVVAVLVTLAIASLNWAEFTRAEPLSFGLFTATVPVGVTMLVIMAIVLTVFLVSSAIQESRYLLDHRRHTRALHAQRELAEKAEASRFTDLRQHLDSHLRETRTRETVMATEFEKRMLQSHQELRAQVERMHQMMAARLDALDARAPVARADATLPLDDVPPRDRVRL
ncbi:hypothetical protein [Ramlibacter sp. PS4R-6]|uniref:hypothetical protein n=1 Tax=Ramlibacter sp. PS4R-6 TaxID=3133438 RepID=UPI0030A67AD8